MQETHFLRGGGLGKMAMHNVPMPERNITEVTSRDIYIYIYRGLSKNEGLEALYRRDVGPWAKHTPKHTPNHTLKHTCEAYPKHTPKNLPC